ncbi:MAG: hypothetical protein DME22_24965 [Verrucomicrobia bacterium]|nr:MAG: hypothetical protein DME22_24965 [Verrucomicrobiota bacterium]
MDFDALRILVVDINVVADEHAVLDRHAAQPVQKGPQRLRAGSLPRDGVQNPVECAAEEGFFHR